MRKAIAAATLAALALVPPAFAQDGLSYNFLELGYANSEIDDLDVDGNGFGVRGSYGFTSNFHGFASYLDEEYDFDIGVSQFEVGAGFNTGLTPKIDFVGTLSFVNLSVDVPGGGNADDSGLALGVGLRGRVSEAFELRGEVKYAEFDDAGNDTTFGVGGRYYFTPMFALGADLGFNDDGTSWMLGGRFDFGKK
jgi:hypothetical protein